MKPINAIFIWIDYLEVTSIYRRRGRFNKTWIGTVENDVKVFNLSIRLWLIGLLGNIRYMFLYDQYGFYMVICLVFILAKSNYIVVPTNSKIIVKGKMASNQLYVFTNKMGKRIWKEVTLENKEGKEYEREIKVDKDEG